MKIGRQLFFARACLYAMAVGAVMAGAFLGWLYGVMGYMREMGELVEWFTRLNI